MWKPMPRTHWPAGTVLQCFAIASRTSASVDSGGVEQSTESGANAAMLRWLWASMKPGMTVRPPTSMN